MTDEQLAELATALRDRADWLDLPRNVEAPCPYISREQFRQAADALDRLRAVVADRAAVVEECARVVDQARAQAIDSREAQVSLNIATRIRALATQQEKDHG